MTLEDKIYETLINNSDTYPIQKLEKIADEFAIGFLSWTNTYKYFALKTNKELLEIYKKEKGL